MSVAPWVVVVMHPVVDDAVVPDGGRAKHAEEAGIDDDGHDHRHRWPLGVLQGRVPLSDDATAMVPITTSMTVPTPTCEPSSLLLLHLPRAPPDYVSTVPSYDPPSPLWLSSSNGSRRIFQSHRAHRLSISMFTLSSKVI